MRRLCAAFLAVGLLGTLAGCSHHVAGICDCDLCSNPCAYGPGCGCGCACAGGGSPGIIHGTGITYGPDAAPAIVTAPIGAPLPAGEPITAPRPKAK